MKPSIADYEWLTSEEGQTCLESARPLADDPLAMISKLRKTLSAAQSHLVAEQIRLRLRAKSKFRHADRMLFTAISLEQSTGEALSQQKALRFSPFGRTADLCCGIGGDLFDLARCSTSSGIDRDPVLVRLCRFNLKATDAEAEVICGDAAQFDIANVDAWHIDPDRRASGTRTLATSHFSPSIAQITPLVQQNPNAALKLAPGTRFESPVEVPLELEWLGHGRECQQQIAWFGELANNPTNRSATVLDQSGALLGRVVGNPTDLPRCIPFDQYVIEPHAAVVAAGLVGLFAAEQRLSAVDRQVAYLTGDRPVHSCGAGCFEVLAAMPFDQRTVRFELRRLGIVASEIKKRAVDVEPRKLKGCLGGHDGLPGVLILTPHEGQIHAVITRRLRRVPQSAAVN